MENIENLIQYLRHIGLNEKEAKVYLHLLALKEATPATLAKWSKVKRSTVYLVLKILCEKGYAHEARKNGHFFYHACSPESVLESLLQRKKALAFAHQHLSIHLQVLFEKNMEWALMPQVLVFKGKDGLIKALRDTLGAKSELLMWANPALAQLKLREAYTEYLEKRVKKGLRVRSILPSEQKSSSITSNNEIFIYDDKVLIISYATSLAVLIQDLTVAQSQRFLFEQANGKSL